MRILYIYTKRCVIHIIRPQHIMFAVVILTTFVTARCYAERGYATVCPSVCLSVTFRYRDLRLEYFDSNFAADQLKVHARADPNMGDVVQREHPKITVE